MSDGYRRKHESGHVKRKKREHIEEEIRKQQGSMLKFIKRNDAMTGSYFGTSGPCTEVLSRSGEDISVCGVAASSGFEQESGVQEEVPRQESGVQEEIPRPEQESGVQEEVPRPEQEYAVQEEIARPELPKCEIQQCRSSDPAEWEVNADILNYYADHIPSQNLDAGFSKRGRQFGDKKRCVRKNYFQRYLANGEVMTRDWLIFSPSTGKVFCYVCKLYSNDQSPTQFKTGFDDWKNATARISSHEQSKDHLCALSNRLQHQKYTRIDAELEKVKQEAYRYWFKVLKRIVAVVRFLSERGLAFRGDNEVVGSPNNGNFLGCLELLAEFDPFLHDHVEKFKNPGKGHVSYLSSTVCEEFIGLMKVKVKEHIITEIKDSKYYGVSIDSTPDISHTDQLAVILRYVLSDGMVVERFVQFIPIERHDGKYLFDILTNLFQQNGIDIAWCRSQCYDNASNMSGIYSGVQSRFKEVNNLAEWVPCAAHSLNLVGSVAVETCTAAVNFFGVVQCIYNFFSASPQRWSILTESLKTQKNAYVVHSMSETRWSARSDAVSALFLNYSEIRQSLINVAEFTGQPPSAAHEAKSLVKKLDAFETALMCTIWNDLLKKINIVNKAIQEPGIELGTVVKMYDSLLAYFSEIRDKFESFEKTAREFSKSDYKEEMQTERKRMRKQFFDEGARDDTVSTMTASDRFRTQTFYPIVDKLIVQMGRRQEAYSVLCDRFGFLVDKSLSQDKVILKARNLVKTYSSDLEECFADEFLLFSNMYPEEKTVNGMLKQLINCGLITSFPNVHIAFRIYLSLFATSCESERSFSKLKRIKNCLRSTMGQERLSSLTLLSIENELLRKIDTNDIIKQFALEKSRKVLI